MDIHSEVFGYVEVCKVCSRHIICDPLWEKVQFRANNEFELDTFIGERVILLANTFYSLI